MEVLGPRNDKEHESANRTKIYDAELTTYQNTTTKIQQKVQEMWY